MKYLLTMRAGAGITSEHIESEGAYPVFGGNGVRGFATSYTHDGTFVLVGRQGALCGNVKLVSGRFWASEHAVVCAARDGHDSRWLAYLLDSLALNQYSVSAAQPGLAVERIANLEVVVSSSVEQSAIADFLDRKTAAIDGLIEKKEQLLEILAEKRQALIDSAATGGETRGTGNEWFPPTPDGWIVKRLKHIAAIHSGIAKGRETNGKPTTALPYLRVANVQNGYLDLTELTELEVTAAEAERFALRPGDVLMNEGGDFDKLGRGFVWEGQVSPCLHQNHVFAVRPRKGVNPYWVNLATQASYLRHFFTLRSKQSTNLASISSTNLGEAPILIPPAPEVEPILRRLEANLTRLDALRAAAVKQVEHLSEYRQALITAAVTGQLDIAAKEAA